MVTSGAEGSGYGTGVLEGRAQDLRKERSRSGFDQRIESE